MGDNRSLLVVGVAALIAILGISAAFVALGAVSDNPSAKDVDKTWEDTALTNPVSVDDTETQEETEEAETIEPKINPVVKENYDIEFDTFEDLFDTPDYQEIQLLD